MNRRILIVFLLLFAIKANAQQKMIQLYNGAAPGSESWTWDEKMKDSTLVYNVVHPTLEVFPADPAIANGTAVIVCPGGGFHILAIKNEGRDVARWLNKKGITAFVLRYRLGHSLTDNPGYELEGKMKKSDFQEVVKPLISLAISDGKAAITYVREHAAEYNVSPSRIGIIGFSAGGTVAASAAYNYTAANRPDFVAPIYAYIPPYLQLAIPADAPPLFIAAATDDELGLAPHSTSLYSSWLASKHEAELHMYTKGGHGFGMRKQDLPTDKWIERYGDWLDMLGYLKPVDPKVAARIAGMERAAKYQDEQLHKDWPNLRRYDKENSAVPPPAPGEKRVVFMGNSITDGWKRIDSSFFAGRHYYDRGIGGQTTGQMLLRFREDVINLQPSVVVILAGINDIAENNGPSKMEDVFGNIVSMAELAKAAHIKVVLSSVMPAHHFPWRLRIDPVPKVTALNQMLKDYAQKNHLVYLDYFTAMADDRRGLPESLSKDGVHPNLAGYKIMEPLAEKAIADALRRR